VDHLQDRFGSASVTETVYTARNGWWTYGRFLRGRDHYNAELTRHTPTLMPHTLFRATPHAWLHTTQDAACFLRYNSDVTGAHRIPHTHATTVPHHTHPHLHTVGSPTGLPLHTYRHYLPPQRANVWLPAPHHAFSLMGLDLRWTTRMTTRYYAAELGSQAHPTTPHAAATSLVQMNITRRNVPHRDVG